VAHIGDDNLLVGDTSRQLPYLIVRPFKELLKQPELAKELKSRGMNCVAAKIAEEVGVLLEHQNTAPSASKQQPRHHPGRPTANDNQVQI
jgi:hypothetical protein